jgi:hypothetical protein
MKENARRKNQKQYSTRERCAENTNQINENIKTLYKNNRK